VKAREFANGVIAGSVYPLGPRSGVYFIVSRATGRYYIGRSSGMAQRVASHRYALKNKRHACAALQACYDQFGELDLAFSAYPMPEGHSQDSLERELLDSSLGEHCFNVRKGGAGRKSTHKDEVLHAFHFRMPKEYREKLELLGGAAWLRDKIKRATLSPQKDES
jgi:hypothetical protein